MTPAIPEGLEVAEPEAPFIGFNAVSPGYFETLGMPLVRGRGFTSADRSPAPGVIVVNASFAEHYWPGEDAVGKTVRVEEVDDSAPLTVVGVVADATYYELGEEDVLQMYFAVTWVAVPAVLVSVALAASLRPARRAARVDPVDAIRSE